MKRRVVRTVLLLTLGGVTNVGVAWGIGVLARPSELERVTSLLEHTTLPRPQGGFGDLYVSFARFTQLGRGLTVSGRTFEPPYPGASNIDEARLRYTLVAGRPYRDSTDLTDGRHPNSQRADPLFQWATESLSGKWIDHEATHATFSYRAREVMGWPCTAFCSMFSLDESPQFDRYLMGRTWPGLIVAEWEPVPGTALVTGERVVGQHVHVPRKRTLPLRPILPGFIINTLFYAVIWFVLLFGWRAHRRLIRKWQGYCPHCKYDLRGDPSGGGCPECGWNRSERQP